MQDAFPVKIGFRAWLLLLSAFASLPMIIFSVISLVFLLEAQRDTEKEHLTRAALSLARDLNLYLSSRASMLRALAVGDAARQGDVRGLYDHAARLLANNPDLFSIALVDREGGILFNTMRPFGEALPKAGDPESARQAIDSGEPQVSTVFDGAVSRQRVTSLGVLVRMGGNAYCLRAVVPVAGLEAILAQQHLPPEWRASILAGPILLAGEGSVAVANGREEGRLRRESHADEEGQLIETALAKVGDWGWHAAVRVPESAFARPVRLMLAKFGAAGGACLLAGLLASYWLSRRLGREVSTLAAATSGAALARTVAGQETIIREMGEVRACLLAARDREEQAMIDPLTCLPGRSRFWELARALERKVLDDVELGLAVLFVDLDGFKQVNDRFGHDRGDWVLSRAADVVRESVRVEDVAGRLGGDEFVVCMTAPQEKLEAAAASTAERIVERVREIGYDIGCSIGVSLCERGAPNLSRALALADQAMYEAKHQGKNRYVLREDTAD